ncbi:MAG: acyl-CoA/acyl-ACP dehydrogenase [Chromatiales bacterium]|nr:acyl-CoA/acyl-ACP dehydrogenase [Chromatiales bacterium]
MPEQLNAKLRELERTAHQFATNVMAPLQNAVFAEEQSEVDAIAQLIDASKTAGFFRMTQPEAYGGTAAGTLQLVVARDALASHNPRWLPEVFGPGPGVLGNTGEPLRSAYLAPLMEGTKRAGFGFTEPSDAEHYTRAERRGDSLIINGRKSYVTRGAEVDFVNVLLDVGDEGRAFVVVDTDRSGVVKERLFGSIDGTHHAAFRFDDVEVPASHLVGVPGEGMPKAMRQIGNTRMIMAAEAVGRARWVIDHLSNRLAHTERHGGVKDSVRLRYGELRIKVYVARSAVYRAARWAQTGENAVNEGIAAKVFATEMLSEVVDGAIQLAGGGALDTDHPLAILYNESRVMRVAEGLSDVLRLNIARGALDLEKGAL